MNNKKLGTVFEQEVCDVLANHGFWVHFITPDARGAQPFDIIAVKNKKAYAIECKTLASSKKYFDISRLEDNQRLSFARWLMCGNGSPLIAVKHDSDILFISYIDFLNSNGHINVWKTDDFNYKRNVNGYDANGCNVYSYNVYSNDDILGGVDV
ncbi:MAG TPA: hypothetical protein DHV37_05935 [Erysipelotrichaceae bacterium]|nr:hypothetical protein [Erysipelotrichaceae bacterium]